MITVKALVERASDGTFAISCEKPVADCYLAGYGSSVQEAKEDFLVCIRESLEAQRELGKTVDIAPEDIKVNYRYDIPSFFNDFDWINVSAFAKLAGVNESKMRAYKSGAASASERTLNKVSAAVATIAGTLSSATL